MGTNFPGSPNVMGFATFSLAMGDWWGKIAEVYMTNYDLYRANGTRYEPTVSVMPLKKETRSYNSFCLWMIIPKQMETGFSKYQKLIKVQQRDVKKP